ncbi:hypothetical protein [Nocardioides sp. B-3]
MASTSSTTEGPSWWEPPDEVRSDPAVIEAYLGSGAHHA